MGPGKVIMEFLEADQTLEKLLALALKDNCSSRQTFKQNSITFCIFESLRKLHTGQWITILPALWIFRTQL